MDEQDVPVTDTNGESPAPHQAGGADPASDPVLRRQLRWIRIWLTVLTVVIVLLVGGGGLAAFGAWTYAREFIGGPSGTQSEEDRSKEMEATIRRAYGSDVESVRVRRLTVDYGASSGIPFMPRERSSAYFVTLALRGEPVQVRGFADPEDAELGGLVPMRGSMAGRLTLDEVKSLMSAYAAESNGAMGRVGPYYDPEMSDQQSAPAKISVSGKDYPTSSVWRVSPGVAEPKGDTLDMNGRMDMEVGDDLIFYRDAKSGNWVFLGSEPGSGMSFPF